MKILSFRPGVEGRLRAETRLRDDLSEGLQLAEDCLLPGLYQRLLSRKQTLKFAKPAAKNDPEPTPEP